MLTSICVRPYNGTIKSVLIAANKRDHECGVFHVETTN